MSELQASHAELIKGVEVLESSLRRSDRSNRASDARVKEVEDAMVAASQQVMGLRDELGYKTQVGTGWWAYGMSLGTRRR